MADRVRGMVSADGYPIDSIDGTMAQPREAMAETQAEAVQNLHRTLDHQMVEMAKIVKNGKPAT